MWGCPPKRTETPPLHNPRMQTENEAEYIRMWEEAYNDPDAPTSFRAVRGMTYALVPADTMRRVKEKQETNEDAIILRRYIDQYGEWHRVILESSMSWPGWVCWNLRSIFFSFKPS